ncbi:MAG: hypothetical protein LBB60_03485 [Desulfovibrio sp.]|jgi:hypothetical protein|nr:hypothetical protein [Desulfovibrio sp.]
MSLRFEGIPLYTLPVRDIQAGYVFVLLSLYIAMRISFGRIKKFLPLLRQVEKIREEQRTKRD